MIQPLLEARAKKCTKFRWFFGVWENLIFCFRNLLTFSSLLNLKISISGSVEGTKGDWIGIDWDDSNRGKHDGSHKRKKYFSTKTETSGSFVRATKISSGKFLFNNMYLGI